MIARGGRYNPLDRTVFDCPPEAELEALMLEEAGAREALFPRLSLLNAFVASTAGAFEVVNVLLAGVRTPDTDVHDCSLYVMVRWPGSYHAQSTDLQLTILCLSEVRNSRSLSVRSDAEMSGAFTTQTTSSSFCELGETSQLFKPSRPVTI